MPQALNLAQRLKLSQPASAATLSPKVAEADPWIFRDGRTHLSSARLLERVSLSLSNSGPDAIADALIQAGELEAGLADAGISCVNEITRVTDALANALCTGERQYAEEARELTRHVSVSEQVVVSPPEGFTYYALHPLDFHHASVKLALQAPSFAIVGIRSIGTTLSAIVLAFLKRQHPASRITVRPKGHPYSRTTSFTQEEERWIFERNTAGAHFIIVDEGPGRSGSTFLSVADALLRLGVQRERITLLGSRQPDPSQLLAADAAKRWAQFHFVSASSSVTRRFDGDLYAGGGCWRNLLLPKTEPWPESWSQMERLKFISADRQTLFKFEGMGRIGADMRERAFSLAAEGFTPTAADAAAGYLGYEVLPGPILTAKDLNAELLDFMANYCVFRTQHFSIDTGSESQLRQMLEFNVPNEFGCEVILPEETFSTLNPIVVDGRMQPHEWVSRGGHGFLKTDAISHGDDHFFPGPCDIAWDLAGIVVEWQLGRQDINTLIGKFERLSGTNKTAARLPAYMLAYSMFRLGFCKMASESVSDHAEQARLRSAYIRYRSVAEELLRTDFSTRRIQCAD